jgi:hypothetical protein
MINKLDSLIRAVCPIEGVSVARWDDRSTWRIDYKSEATPAQRASAQQAMDAFVPAPYTADEIAAIYADGVDKTQFRIMFQMINRIRALEGQAPLTVPQFKQYVADQYKLANP